jgi:pantoate--beta-alanine ligase
VLDAEPGIALDYLALVDPMTLTDVPHGTEGPALLAVAAKVGTTRLIDNVPITLGSASKVR